MRILAIDPGNKQSAWVVYDSADSLQVGIFDIQPNEDVLNRITPTIFNPQLIDGIDFLAIEMVACYGMAVGKEVFETCVWIGRFLQAWGKDYQLVYRGQVKMNLCRTMKAKDANIRQAIIDRFGPGKEKAIGLKKSPGPLYGMSSHCWAALGVALTVADTAVSEITAWDGTRPKPVGMGGAVCQR